MSQEQQPNLIDGLDALAEACSLQQNAQHEIGGAIRSLLQMRGQVLPDGASDDVIQRDLINFGEEADEPENKSRNKTLERTIIVGGILGTIFSMLNTEFNRTMGTNERSPLLFTRPTFNITLTPEEQQEFCVTFGQFFSDAVTRVSGTNDKFLEVATVDPLNTITIGNELMTIHNDATSAGPNLRVTLSIGGGEETDITPRLKLIPGQDKLNGYKVTAWCVARISTIHFELHRWGDLVGTKDEILAILQNPIPQSPHEERMNTAFEYALYGYEEAAKLQRYTETRISRMSGSVMGTFDYFQNFPRRLLGSIPERDQVELYIARKLPVLWPVLILTKDYPLHALVITLLLGYLLSNEIRSVCGLISRFTTFIKDSIRSAGQRFGLIRRNGGGAQHKFDKMVSKAAKALTGKINKLSVSVFKEKITEKNKKFIQPSNFILNHLSFLLDSIKEKTTELVNTHDKKEGGKRKHKKTKRNKRSNRRRTYRKSRR
jgi:hypothetical protein